MKCPLIPLPVTNGIKLQGWSTNPLSILNKKFIKLAFLWNARSRGQCHKKVFNHCVEMCYGSISIATVFQQRRNYWSWLQPFWVMVLLFQFLRDAVSRCWRQDVRHRNGIKIKLVLPHNLKISNRTNHLCWWQSFTCVSVSKKSDSFVHTFILPAPVPSLS